MNHNQKPLGEAVLPRPRATTLAPSRPRTEAPRPRQERREYPIVGQSTMGALLLGTMAAQMRGDR